MLDRLLVLNLALITAHQLDAVWWREWHMFGLPGGIEVYLLLNLLLYLPLLGALGPIYRREAKGYHYSLLIAALCASVLPLHAGYALAGVSGFESAFSISLMLLCFLAAALQAWATVRSAAQFSAAPL